MFCKKKKKTAEKRKTSFIHMHPVLFCFFLHILLALKVDFKIGIELEWKEFKKNGLDNLTWFTFEIWIEKKKLFFLYWIIILSLSGSIIWVIFGQE